MMFDLTGKTALVTGASGGIGAAIAKSLQSQGAHVVLHGTRLERLEALKAELGDNTSIAAANLSDRDAVAGLVPAAEAAAGAVESLILPPISRLAAAALFTSRTMRWRRISGL